MVFTLPVNFEQLSAKAEQFFGGYILVSQKDNTSLRDFEFNQHSKRVKPNRTYQ